MKRSGPSPIIVDLKWPTYTSISILGEEEIEE